MRLAVLILSAALLALPGLSVVGLAVGPVAAAAEGPPWSRAFDPKRDPDADLREAMALAQATGRHILVDVGGDWCVWCRLLDNLFATDADLSALKERNFVTLKVHYDKTVNRNEAFLSRYPKIAGYPHLFVLAPDGALLHSQDTAALELPKEAGKGHDRAKVAAFLEKWAPKPKGV